MSLEDLGGLPQTRLISSSGERERVITGAARESATAGSYIHRVAGVGIVFEEPGFQPVGKKMHLYLQWEI